MKKRMNDTVARKAEILAAALIVATEGHYAHMTRASIAAIAGVTGPLVQHYLGTMPELRREVMKAAILAKNLTVIAQGLMAKDIYAELAPKELRQAAARSLV